MTWQWTYLQSHLHTSNMNTSVICWGWRLWTELEGVKDVGLWGSVEVAVHHPQCVEPQSQMLQLVASVKGSCISWPCCFLVICQYSHFTCATKTSTIYFQYHSFVYNEYRYNSGTNQVDLWLCTSVLQLTISIVSNALTTLLQLC